MLASALRRSDCGTSPGNRAAADEPGRPLEGAAGAARDPEAEAAKRDEKAEIAPPTATSRVIAVEPATPDASTPAAPAPAETAKVAAVDATSPDTTPKADGSAPSPTPDIDTLSKDIQAKLKEYGCYGGKIDASWGSGTRSGVERFNTLASLDLNSDAPE